MMAMTIYKANMESLHDNLKFSSSEAQKRVLQSIKHSYGGIESSIFQLDSEWT